MRCIRPVPSSSRSCFGALLLVLLMANSGCGGRGNVTGKVTYKNKPVTWGQIRFEGSDGATRQGSIDKDGSFIVEDLALGEAKVAVESPNPKSITLVSKGDRPPAPAFPDVPNWVALPIKYEAVTKSGLTFPITRGENKIDVDLK
jgi:hypothetical protein